MLNQQGIRDVPEFPLDEYDIHRTEEVHEWLYNHEIGTEASKVSLAYQGSARRYLKRKDIVETLQKIAEEFGPIGFITNGSEEEKEFFKAMFDEDEEDEDDDFEGIEYEGFVVSEEEGVEKPDPELFEKFLEEREEPAEKFVYFGNDPEEDSACEEAGMEFVWVDSHETFGNSWDGAKIYKLTYENVKEAMEEVAGVNQEDGEAEEEE